MWLGIAYAVSVVSQSIHTSNEDNMNWVLRILRYLKNVLGKGLLFKKEGELSIVGYTYLDWVGNQIDKRSTFGYFIFVERNLITWWSKKQKVVSKSSVKAEFRGTTRVSCKLWWIRKVLRDMRINYEEVIIFYCDNKYAIEVVHYPVQLDRTKHVEVDYNFI